MEITGQLKVSLVLKSTVNKHHIRRVKLYGAWGTKQEAAKEVHGFMEANPEVAHMNLEVVFQPREDHVSLDELSQLGRKK